MPASSPALHPQIKAGKVILASVVLLHAKAKQPQANTITESIVTIQHILESQPHLSRTKIAEYVCEHFKFHNAHGKPQTDNCMKALRDLEQTHGFVLPAPRFSGRRQRSVKRLGQAVELPVAVPAKAGEVLGLHLIQVSNDDESLIWNELMMREHPRQAGTMVGAQLRYLIASDHGWLGGFGFAASALTIRDRDQWIGWDHNIRRQHQFRVVNMSRFLIRPSVHCRLTAWVWSCAGWHAILKHGMAISHGYWKALLMRQSIQAPATKPRIG